MTCAGIHARLDDLEGDDAPDRLLLLGHVDDAEAALADLLQQLVGANHAANVFRRHVSHESCGLLQRILGRRLGAVHEKSHHRCGRMAFLGLTMKVYLPGLARCTLYPGTTTCAR